MVFRCCWLIRILEDTHLVLASVVGVVEFIDVPFDGDAVFVLDVELLDRPVEGIILGGVTDCTVPC